MALMLLLLLQRTYCSTVGAGGVDIVHAYEVIPCMSAVASTAPRRECTNDSDATVHKSLRSSSHTVESIQGSSGMTHGGRQEQNGGASTGGLRAEQERAPAAEEVLAPLRSPCTCTCAGMPGCSESHGCMCGGMAREALRDSSRSPCNDALCESEP